MTALSIWKQAREDTKGLRHRTWFWTWELLVAPVVSSVVAALLPDIWSEPSVFGHNWVWIELWQVLAGAFFTSILMLFPISMVFSINLVRAPSRLLATMQRELLAYKTDDIANIIRHLKDRRFRVRNWSELTKERVEHDSTFLDQFMEIADDLAADGVTPAYLDSSPFRGMYARQLNILIAELRKHSLVAPQHRTVEHDRGQPYTVTDWFLTDLGAAVARRVESEWEIEFADDQ